MAELCERVRAGDREAADTVIRENMGLVFKALSQLSLHADDDLLQVGRIGLWKAARLYDASKTQYSTFAVLVVRQSIVQHMSRVDRSVKAVRMSGDGPAYHREAATELCGPAVERALAILPERLRPLFRAMYGGERALSYTEGARAIGMSACTAANHHRDALAFLRRAWPLPPE